MQFFTNLEAVESRSRSLKLQSIDGLFESRTFEKGAISLNVYQRIF